MDEFRIRMVGEVDVGIFEACSAQAAVAAVAGCDLRQVGLPIWRRGHDGFWPNAYRVECYMPRDDSGRQWIVVRSASA